MDVEPNDPVRRGYSRQCKRRAAEFVMRRSVLRTTRWLEVRGYGEGAAAQRVGLVARTTRSWQERWKTDHLASRPRGRPTERADRDVRNAILSQFFLLGPDISLERLDEEIPDISRAELRDLRRRYRVQWRLENVRFVSALRWRKPGSVWAMDFTQPPLPVDGVFPRILVARDLASGLQLEALPTLGETAEEACDLLRALILRHGAPLVIKTDNGSAFRSEAFATLLAKHGILHLKSPPYTPSYNGAAETGIGTLKTHAHHISARHDRPGEWTCDDVEEARLLGNAYARPFGCRGGSPDEAWEMHRRTTDNARRRLREVYDEEVENEEKRRGVLPLIGPSAKEKDSIDRFAISKALRRCGYLEIRRRRITPPVHSRKAARIS
jgi:transposase InsO family protein